MKLSAIFLVSTLAMAECGLTNWFNEWTDELAPRDTHPIYLKSSRHPLIVGKANPLPMVKRESETDNRFEEDSECAQCMNQRSCQESGLCHCKHLCSEQEYTKRRLSLPETVGIGAKSSTFPDILSHTLYPAGTFTGGPIKAVIATAIGAADPNDIDLVSVWVSTRSNHAPDLSNFWQRESSKKNGNIKELDGNTAGLQEQQALRERHDDDDDGGEKLIFPSGTKVNPSLIEAPPPFVKSSHSQNPTIKPAGPLNPDLIVEPSEFSTEEPPTFESRAGALQETAQSIKTNNDMDRALHDAKSMIEDMQDRAADGDLLGASKGQRQQMAILNPHFAEGVQDINNYVLNRAQDTLDVIGQHPAAQDRRDSHSDLTRKAIVDLKTVPQYVLGQIQDTIKRPIFKTIRDSPRVPEGRDDDQLVGEPKKKPSYFQGTTEAPTTLIDDMIYFVSDLPPTKGRTVAPTVTTKPSRLMEILGSLKTKRPLTVPDTSTYPNDHEFKTQPELSLRFPALREPFEEESNTQTEGSLPSTTTESAREVLKNKIRSYIETLKRSREEKLQAAASGKTLAADSEKKVESRNFQTDSFVKESPPELTPEPVTAKQENVEEEEKEQKGEEVEDEEKVEMFNSNLGTFVSLSNSSNASNIYFVGTGVKLPIETRLNPADGSVQLRLDLDKLCNCQNITCPKNHTKIEETVGAILEKEAELEEQLHEMGVDATKSNIAKRSPDDVAKQLQSTVANSVRNLENTVEQFHKKVAKALSVNKNDINRDALLNQINKDLAMNKNFNWNVNDYVKKLEREKVLRKLMQQLNIEPHSTLGNGLKQAQNQASDLLGSNQMLMNKLTNGVNDPLKPVQDRMQDINDKISSVYQNAQINALEDKLKKLNNEVDKYERENEKLFVEESGRVLAGPNSKVIQKEVNLVSKILAWLNHLSDFDNDNRV